MTPEQELDLRMAEPEVESPVAIKVQYPESPKTYTYAAIGFDDGNAPVWYLSGISSNDFRKTWDSLITWFKNRNIEVISIKQATSWEDLL